MAEETPAAVAETAPAPEATETAPAVAAEVAPNATDNVPNVANDAIVVDTHFSADDEGIDEGASLQSSSYMTSLNSSIYNYKYENGRRYHAFREGSYFVPNDDQEQERMDLVHHIYRLLLDGKLYKAPIDNNINRVLDVGTGTGIWAMDFADEHPEAEVMGTDLSPIQPKWTPPNCLFVVDDFESDWIYRRPFDFIFSRELEGCIGDEKAFFRHAYENLKSGGYMEIQGVNAAFKSDDDTAKLAVNAMQWMDLMVTGAAKFGKAFDVSTRWKQLLLDAGFVDVHQEVMKLPIGGWPKDPKLKEIGKVQYIQELEVIESYTPGLVQRVHGWSSEETRVLMAKTRADMRNPDYHLYLPVYFCWGRKP